MGEFDLIERYFKRPTQNAVLGVGDDCALLAPTPGMQLAISSDMLVEGRHFLSTVDPARLNPRRSYQMPVLRFTVAELVDALCARFGEDRRALVQYVPDPFIQKLFASYPPLHTPEALALGLRHDGDIDTLITRAMS